MKILPTNIEVLEFEDIAVANILFGPQNKHLEMLALASESKLYSCGATLYIETSDRALSNILCQLFLQSYALVRDGIPLSFQDLLANFKLLSTDANANLRNMRSEMSIITPQKTISPRNLAQDHYLRLLKKYELVFAVGAAGTGKSYLAVAMALAMLQQRKVKRIILTRPAVEAGEKLGFLPGDLAEKVNPYLRPLYDALYDMVPNAKVTAMLEMGTIEIAPLAFMRGRTLNDAFVILDEAQNTSREQMKMFLTRMGFGTRIVVTGDVTQIDLPIQHGDTLERSGLVHALKILEGLPNVAIQRFSHADVVRHPLVGAIINAYNSEKKS